MKTTLIYFLLLASISVTCQVVDIDQLDKRSKTYTYKVDVSKGNVWRNSDRISEGIFDKVYLSTKLIKRKTHFKVMSNFNFFTGRMICATPQNGEVTFFFKDRSELVLKQKSEPNCSGALDVEYSLGKNLNETTSNLINLASKDIVSFRVKFDESEHFFKMRRKKYKLVKKHFGMILDNLISKKHNNSGKNYPDYYALTK